MRPLIAITPRISSDKQANPVLEGSRSSYVESVIAAGGAPFVVPYTRDTEVLRAVFEQADGLLLPGGEDVDPTEYGEAPHEKLGGIDKTRDYAELTLARWAIDEETPILGICRGCQVLNIARGGTLFQDLHAQRPTEPLHEPGEWEELKHEVSIEPTSKLAAIMGERAMSVNSLHHQAVKDPGKGVLVTARSQDGVIEGIEVASHPYAVAVQWHPEVLWQKKEPNWMKLFKSFIAACRR